MSGYAVTAKIAFFWNLTSFVLVKKMVKCKGTSTQACPGPEGFRRLRLPEFQDNRHIKVVRFSDLRTGRLYTPGNMADTHFC